MYLYAFVEKLTCKVSNFEYTTQTIHEPGEFTIITYAHYTRIIGESNMYKILLAVI